MADHKHRDPSRHQFPLERRHVLMDEERSRRLPPEPLLRAAGISEGDVVIDIGAGNGFWTIPLSRVVGPSGKVFAADIEPVMLADLRALVKAEGAKNVELAQSEELHVPLADGIADAVLHAFVLHHPSDPIAFLREAGRLLKPGGLLLEVDWQKRPTENGPPVEHRLSEEETRLMLEEAGFEVTALEVPNADVYAMVGRKSL
jgi:ubiquinone/menaquinone biosynthesis C-methylase UbiE